MYEEIVNQAKNAMAELLECARTPRGGVVVVGCSTSEIMGQGIGKASAPELGEAVYQALFAVVHERGLYIAAQCCEHLNRALIIEREAAEKYGYEIVCVRPRPKAGGSFATAAWEHMREPVAVESVRADAGMDVGGTLIGMHLKPVAVPIRLNLRQIGEAPVTAARTRPKLIGGARAEYPEIQ